jgi:hypothetical protein
MKKKAAPRTRTAPASTASEIASVNTEVLFGWTRAEDLEHIDIDERHAKVELFLVPNPPEGYKATNIVVHFDLSSVPENVVVFTQDHPEPITDKTYAVELKDMEFRHGAITDDTPMPHLPKIALFLATGAFADWMKNKRAVDDPYALPVAQESTFQIRVSKIVCRTVRIENVPEQAQIVGDPIEITVKD